MTTETAESAEQANQAGSQPEPLPAWFAWHTYYPEGAAPEPAEPAEPRMTPADRLVGATMVGAICGTWGAMLFALAAYVAGAEAISPPALWGALGFASVSVLGYLLCTIND